ncbi:tape measure protein [Pseudomonas lactis]|uniref:tape measure protein n=1 Tax=Pseudomonas lactis TaxID=1615674 RepID=UPI00190996FF|nr:tape measure protein [Pseudomonas lactis]MBK3444105.1 tape measure protein [Pseudomonas lactis]
MADADVQGLLIRIEATTAQLRQELAAGESAVAKAASQIDRSLGSADSAFDRLGKKAQATTSLIRGAMAGIAGAGLIGGLIKQADAYGQMADRMRAATSSSAEYEMVQKHILTTAQETYRPLHEAQELYIRTADVMKGLGYNTQQTLNITDSFSYLLVTNAASADKAGTALDAYSKSLQTGKIDADSWVSIMTAMPTVAEAIATATGKTSKEIRKLGAGGKLSLSDLNLGLEQVRDSAQKAAAAMSTSVMDALNNINNAIGAYIGKANESTSATGELAKVLDLVAKNIDIVAAAGAGLVAAGVTGYMLKNSVAAWNSVTAMVAEAKATRDAAAAKVEATAASAALAAVQATETSAVVVGARSTEASAIAKLRVIQAARDQLAYTVALSKGTQEEARYTAALAATDIELAAAKKAAFAASAQLGAALTAESAAMAKDAAATTAASVAKKEYAAVSSLAARAGSGLLALLGGPVGIAALAVGAGVAFLTMRDSTDQAAISLDEMKAPLDQVIAKFKALNEDQRKAALVRWGEAQAKAAKDAASEFGNLATSIRSATVDPSQARLGGYSVQLKEYTALIDRLKEAQASGQALTPILEGLRGKAGIDDAQIDSWIKQAGVVSDAGGVLKDVTLKLNEQTGALATNTAETNANNAAKAGMSAAGTTYLEALQKQLAGLQDGGDATKIANRYIQEHSDLTETDKVAILSAASAIEANKEATKRATAAKKTDTGAAKEAATEAKNQAKALTDLQAQADIAIKSAVGLAAAYLDGTDRSREFSLQQKVDEALLKTGSAARDEVIAKLTAQQDAQDKLNISKSAYDLGKETADIIAQAKATLMGADALAAYNLEKSMTIALAGKNIEVGSKEYEQLLAANKAQQEAVKIAQRAANAGGIMDRLYPEAKLLKDYTEDQKALNAAMALYPGNAANYQAALLKLGNEYEVNRSKATLWGQMTEGAIDRIDEAFATAWGNIGSGAESLWDNLKKGFKQTLGEIAHMLTTKPLLASISNWLTGTDNGQGLGSVWSKLLGSAGNSGGSSGGGMFSGMLGIGKNLMSVWNTITGVGSSVASGYASGGVSGALSGGVGYYGNMLSSLGSTLSSGFSSIVSSITGTAAASTAATTGATSALGGALSGAVAEGAASIGTNIGIAGATTAAASNGIGAAISSAMSSAAAMWPLAIVMGMYQSGKLYSAGVRPDAGEMWDSAGSTALGKAAMLPQTVGAKYFEVTDNILGKVVGGKMAAILSGSTLFQAVWSKVGSKLFGSGYKTKDTGIELGVDGGLFDAQQYTKQKKKGGLLSGSSKTRYLHSALDAETQDALGSAYNEKILNSMGLFSALGVELSESVLDGLNMATTRISTQGKTPEAIQEQLDAWFGKLGDSAVAAINAATNSGLQDYNFEALTTFVNNLYSVNAAVESLGVKAVGFTVAGGKAVETMIAVSGGIEALSTGMNDYYSAFTTEVDKSADSLAAARAEFTKFGFALPDTRDGLKEVVQALDLTTEIGQNMFSAIVRNATAASQAYGILEARESAYRSAFFSEAENTAYSIAETTKQLKEMGITLPASRAAYRQMIEAQDRTTVEGKKMFDTLMNAAGAAGTVFDALKVQADALAAKLNQGVTDSFSLFQRSISAQQKAATAAYNATNTSLSDMSATAVKSVTDLSSVSNSLESALKSLRGTSDDAVKTLRAQAQATLQSALATARSGKSLSGFTGLEDALDTVSDNNTDLYGSMEDFARDQGRTANVVAELNAINGKQLTAAEKLQKSIEDQIGVAKQAYDAQMAQFDQQLEFAQAQMDAFNGIDTSVKSVEAAIKALNGSLIASLAAKPATGAGSAMANTAANNATVVDTLYQQLFGRTADAGENKYWADRLGSGNLPYAEIVANMTQYASAADKAAMAAKGHATGGLITGPGTGTSDSILARLSNGEYVMTAEAVRMFGTGMLDQMNAGLLPAFAMGGGIGEAGPQLEVTGPSRIYAPQPRAQASSGQGSINVETLGELKAILQEMRTLSSHAKKTSDNTDQLATVGTQVIGTVQVKEMA